MFAIQPELLDTIQRSHIDFLNYIGLVKSGYQVVFLFLNKNICCGYSLEAPQWGASNEYPQHMFLLRNKKNIDTFWLKNVPYQELCKFLDFMYGEMLRVSGYFE